MITQYRKPRGSSLADAMFSFLERDRASGMLNLTGASLVSTHFCKSFQTFGGVSTCCDRYGICRARTRIPSHKEWEWSGLGACGMESLLFNDPTIFTCTCTDRGLGGRIFSNFLLYIQKKKETHLR